MAFGLDVSVGLTKTINARLGVSQIDFDDDNQFITVGDDGDKGDIDADLESDADDELDDFDFWPVLVIGINYAF